MVRKAVVGWRVLGMVKQEDGTRVLQAVSARIYQSKEAAADLRVLCDAQDPELRAYIAEVERRDRLGMSSFA